MKLRRASFTTKIVVFALIVYAAVSLINLRGRIAEARTRQAELRLEVTALEVANDELKYKLEHRDDDETIAAIGHDELGLTYPGERVFK
jgi:cell division protein FtsB